MKQKATTAMQTIMRNIEALRILKGWDAQETATHLHISKNSYSNYKHGHHIPPVTLIDSAVRVFGITAAQICTPMDLWHKGGL